MSSRAWTILTSTSLFVLLVFSHTTMSQDGDEIIVDNDPDAIFEESTSSKVYVARPISDAFLKGKLIFSTDGQTVNTNSLFFPTDVLIESAWSLPTVQVAAMTAGLSKEAISLEQMKDILDKVKYSQDIANFSGVDSIRPLSIRWPTSSTPDGTIQVDATALTNLLAEGALDIGGTKKIKYSGMTFDAVPMHDNLSPNVLAGYQSLLLSSSYNSKLVAEYANKALEKISSDYSVAKALTVEIGEVNFGKVVVYTAKEKKLSVPNYISKNSDIYWIEFRANLGTLPLDNISEAIINIKLPESAIAWELAPLRVGLEVSTEEKVAIPEISVGGVSIGEIFSNSVTYSYLKPVVLADGLGESSFSWILREEALSSGSHKFIGVIGVPKGSKKLFLLETMFFRLTPGILEGYGVISEGDLAISNQEEEIVEF